MCFPDGCGGWRTSSQTNTICLAAYDRTPASCCKGPGNFARYSMCLPNMCLSCCLYIFSSYISATLISVMSLSCMPPSHWRPAPKMEKISYRKNPWQHQHSCCEVQNLTTFAIKSLQLSVTLRVVKYPVSLISIKCIVLLGIQLICCMNLPRHRDWLAFTHDFMLLVAVSSVLHAHHCFSSIVRFTVIYCMCLVCIFCLIPDGHTITT